MPGCMIAIGRLNIPSVFVYGGTIAPGKLNGEDIDIVSAFEAVGQFNKDQIDEEQLKMVECHACPGPGSCGGMYTANTMASAIEAMGMSLPGNSSNPAVTDLKRNDCYEAGQAVIELLKREINYLKYIQRRHLKMQLPLSWLSEDQQMRSFTCSQWLIRSMSRLT